MRRLLALSLVALLLVGSVAPAAEAGSATGNVALGLAAFAVFNQLVGVAHAYHRPHRVVVYTTPVFYGAPEVIYAGPMVTVVQPTPTVIQYPHGRYELRGDGVTTPYQWVWIPNPPPPPPPPPAPSAPAPSP